MVPSEKTMDFQVERSEFDAESGFFYYVSFKPDLSIAGEDISAQMTCVSRTSLAGSTSTPRMAPCSIGYCSPRDCRAMQPTQ